MRCSLCASYPGGHGADPSQSLLHSGPAVARQMDCVPSGAPGHAHVGLVVVADVEDPLRAYVLPFGDSGEGRATVLGQAELSARVDRCDRVRPDNGVQDAVKICLMQIGVRHRDDAGAGSSRSLEEFEQGSIGAQVLDVDIDFIRWRSWAAPSPSPSAIAAVRQITECDARPQAARW